MLTKIKLLNSDGVDILRNQFLLKNLKDIEKLDNYLTKYNIDLLESNYEMDPKIDLLIDKSIPQKEADIENSLRIYEALPGLSRHSLRDEPLWVTLAFGTFFDYAKSRWPLKTNDPNAISTVALNHWFISGSRSMWRDHAISRLWWMASYAQGFENLSPKEVLQIIYINSELPNSFFGRPTTVSSKLLTSQIFFLLKERFLDISKPREFQREEFRNFMKEIDLRCGAIEIDALEINLVKKFVKEIFDKNFKK